MKRNRKLVKESLFGLIDIYIAKGDLSSAQEVLNEYKIDIRIKNYHEDIIIKQAQLYFLKGEYDSITTHLKNDDNKISIDNEQYNDLLDIRSLLAYFKDLPDEFLPFTTIQLKLHRNKREEAIEQLLEYINFFDNSLLDLIQYQTAYLLFLQGDFSKALEVSDIINGESVYTELSIILKAEIYDYMLNDLNLAIDNYLLFLEKYPNSIYYDKVRIRIRELAS